VTGRDRRVVGAGVAAPPPVRQDRDTTRDLLASVRETVDGLRKAGVLSAEVASEVETLRRAPVAERPVVDERRSRLMARVRQRDTKPEMSVRRAAHALGFRFRLQRRDLPGRPDLVFPRLRKALFVHGCFWHSHPSCKAATIPKTRTEYWNAKLADNRSRDRRVEAALKATGWEVGVVWECETRNRVALDRWLLEFLAGRLDYPGKPADHEDSASDRSER
jgi:DNA mismatch endonuclease (patch repair protein)